MSIFRVSDWMVNENEDVRQLLKAIDPEKGRRITQLLIEGADARAIAEETGIPAPDVRVWEKAHIFEIREARGLRPDGTPGTK